MTKKQLKEAYTNWNREITKLGERKREIFKELQEMCAEKGDGNRWCCIEKLVAHRPLSFEGGFVL